MRTSVGFVSARFFLNGEVEQRTTLEGECTLSFKILTEFMYGKLVVEWGDGDLADAGCSYPVLDPLCY